MVVLVVVALVFGPSRVTGLARSLGESIHEFRAAQHAAETADQKEQRDG